MLQVPDVNGAWMDTFVRRYEQVDINLIIGAGSYIATPLLRNVTTRGLGSIASETAQFEDILFTEEAGGDLLEAENMALGTFSIHNLGIYGVKAAAPIVLTPQACALALGAIAETVVPSKKGEGVEGEVWCVAPVMTATLSCDHRVVDGAVGAQWLAAFKSMVENPVTMLL
jgi:pyruvate dehydrogenase E2 component (dihydrolipoamide acetyltransferase)